MEKQKQIPSAKECALYGVTEEVKYLVSLVGIGFHPDTDFNDHIIRYKQHFKPKSAKILNARLDECFKMCEMYDLDIYEIAMEVVKPLL